MKMKTDFAVFILTHQRVNEQKTLKTLKDCGYTGKTFLIVDDEDSQCDEYIKKYKDMVKVFSKKEIENIFDTMTNLKEYRSVVYARNVSYKIARDLGIKYIFMCDDDITDLEFRVLKDQKLKGYKVKNIDLVFENMISIMKMKNVGIFGFSQAGAFIGGANGNYMNGIQRKIAQAIMLDVDKPIEFRGIFNEDLQASLDAGIYGNIAMSTMLISITSPERMSNSGGLHDLYNSNNTYIPCFYTLLAYPNVASVEYKNDVYKLRIKHSSLAPMILSSKWRK